MSGEALPDASRPGASGRGAAGPVLKAVISHRWVVMLVALATVAGAVAYLATRKPQYKADVRLLFTPLQSGDGAQGLPLVVASADPTRDAQTAATLLGGPRAAALAAQRLGHGWTPQRVAQAASVVQVGESNVIVVEATAPSVGQATRVATAFAGASLALRRTVLMSDARALSATVPIAPQPGDAAGQARRAEINLVLGGADPNFTRIQDAAAAGSTAPPASAIMLLAGVGGIALGLVGAVLLEMFSNRVRDGEELRALYPVPVLTYLPPLSRRKRTRTSRRGLPGESMAAAHLLASRLEVRAHGSQVVLATGSAAGDGTTTTMLQLAQALIATGRRVLFVDADVRSADATRRLGIDRQGPGVTDLLSGNGGVADCVVPAPRLPGLQVLPAGAHHRRGPVLGGHLREVIIESRALAEYVLVDTPPLVQVSDAVAVLADVDEILVVARPGHTRHADFTQLRDLLDASSATAVNMVVVGERSWQRQPPSPATATLADGARPQDATPVAGTSAAERARR